VCLSYNSDFDITGTGGLSGAMNKYLIVSIAMLFLAIVLTVVAFLLLQNLN
jgi:hypothetical protein